MTSCVVLSGKLAYVLLAEPLHTTVPNKMVSISARKRSCSGYFLFNMRSENLRKFPNLVLEGELHRALILIANKSHFLWGMWRRTLQRRSCYVPILDSFKTVFSPNTFWYVCFYIMRKSLKSNTTATSIWLSV